MKIKNYDYSEIFLVGNQEEILFFDLRKKENALKFENTKYKLQNFLQIENNNNLNYFSAIDPTNNRTLLYDFR